MAVDTQHRGDFNHSELLWAVAAQLGDQIHGAAAIQ
jgi:hypothetical protein